MRMCAAGFGIFLALLVGVGFAAIVQSVKAADTNERPYEVIAVFSADFCGPCKDLEAWLKRNGYPVMVTETREQPAVEAFPTVFYETPEHRMHSDNGQLIYNWQTERPAKEQPVEIILWRTKQ